MTFDGILSTTNDRSHQQQGQEQRVVAGSGGNHFNRMLVCPPVSGNKRRLVVPSRGDFSIRLRLPDAFLENFHIHVNPISLHLYQKFIITRKFVVMVEDGAFFTNINHRVLTMTDLPRNPFLPTPSFIGKWDVLKVLDLVRCRAKEIDLQTNMAVGARTWELVLVRWRNGRSSWIPIEMISSNPFCMDVLQAFYMNTINSWGFIDRIFPQNLTRYQTEVELWRNHAEFQALFAGLPQHLDTNIQQHQQTDRHYLMNRSNGAQSSPTAASVSQSELPAQQDVKVNFDIPPLEPANVESTHIPVSPRSNSPRLPNQCQNTELSNEIQIEVPCDATPSVLDQPVNPEPSNLSMESISSRLPATSNSPEPRKKKRRLRQCQTTDSSPVDDEDEENNELLNQLSQPKHATPASTSSLRRQVVLLDGDESDKSGEDQEAEILSTRRKRLTQSQTSVLSSDSEDDDLPLSTLSQKQHQAPTSSNRTIIEDDEEENEVSNANTRNKQNEVNVAAIMLDEDDDDKKSSSSSATEMEEEEEFALDPNFISPALTKYLDHDDEVDSKESEKKIKDGLLDSTEYLLSLATQTTTMTERIECVCGATAIGRYTGTWLQCWHLECGRWEHAECVGYFGLLEEKLNEIETSYRCSTCDPLAYKKRKKKQLKEETLKNSTVVWMHMFQCIETHNSRCLLQLFHQSCPLFPKSRFIDVTCSPHKSTLMMKLSEHGLVGCLHYFLEEIKAFVFVYDAFDRNAMHYAVLGDRGTFSLRCMELLEAFGHEKLLVHQDKHGQTPFHLLLQQSSPEFLPFAERQLSRVDLKQADITNNWSAIHFLSTRPLEPLVYFSTIQTSSTEELIEKVDEKKTIISSLLRLFVHFLEFSPMVLRSKSIRGHTPLMLLLQQLKCTFITRSQVVDLCLKILSVFNDFDPLGGIWLDRDLDGWMPWHHALMSGNHALIDALLQLRTSGHVELTLLMDPHALTYDHASMSALHLAALHDFPWILKILLQETNLNVLLQDGYGYIPLLYASGSVACVREFFQFQILEQLQLIKQIEDNCFRLRERVKQLKQTIVSDSLCLQLVNEAILKRGHLHLVELGDRYLLTLDSKLLFLKEQVMALRATKSTKQSIPICKTDQLNKHVLTTFLLEQVDAYNKWYTPMEFTKWSDQHEDIFSSRNTHEMNDLISFFLTSITRMEKSQSNAASSTTDEQNDLISMSTPSQWTKWLQLLQLKGKFCAHGLLFGCSIDLTKWTHWPILREILNMTSSSFSCQETNTESRKTLLHRIGVQLFLHGFEQVLPGVLHLFHAEEFAVALQFTWTRPATKMDIFVEWFQDESHKIAIEQEEDDEEMCLLVMDEESNVKKKRAFIWFKRFLCVELTLLEQILLLRTLHLNSSDTCDALEPIVYVNEPNWIDLEAPSYYDENDQEQTQSRGRKGGRSCIRSMMMTTTSQSRTVLDFPRHILLQEDATYEEDFCPLLFQWLRHTDTAYLPS